MSKTYHGHVEVVDKNDYQFYYQPLTKPCTTFQAFKKWSMKQLYTILSNEHIDLNKESDEVTLYENGLEDNYDIANKYSHTEFRLSENTTIICRMWVRIS